jgi:DNA-binding NarL/FixJ family response regulator
LQELPGHQPEVVLMDIQLPKMSGIECTTQLKKLLPSVKIIMVTVYEDTERISAALRAGACGYLLKRCTPEDLVAAVREARLGGVPMPREIARKVIAAFQQPITSASEVEDLRPSEKKILELLAHSLSNKEIANRLGLSASTVRWHLENIYGKLHVGSRTAAVLKFHSTKGSQSK